MGAMASKKASPSTPRRARIASESASEVRGPVATTAGPSGSPVTSSRSTRIPGWAVTAAVMASEKRVRSTARAAPAGTRVVAAERRRTEPSASISRLRAPWAFAGSSLLKEFVQTSSPRPSVWWAGVLRTGRISTRRTSCPRSASWRAASHPASPPPTTVTSATLSGTPAASALSAFDPSAPRAAFFSIPTASSSSRSSGSAPFGSDAFTFPSVT
jgi:hypothetical protein